jgi:hypothetical protein
MREGIQDPGRPPLNTRVLWSGAILVTVGVSLFPFAGEWFAAFDACLANPLCSPPAAIRALEGLLGLILAGVGFTVGGVMILLSGLVGLAHSVLWKTPSS